MRRYSLHRPFPKTRTSAEETLDVWVRKSMRVFYLAYVVPNVLLLAVFLIASTYCAYNLLRV